MFSREIKLILLEDGKYKLEWKVAEGFYQYLKLKPSELDKLLSDYRMMK